ncbi:hypothetical protein K3X44_02090 [Aliiroseovarius crassostreae]|uniref:DUF6638 family protein n=1 Tax=Aliiroseovarius crassostreae TaxID=154981 RepID=UPI0022047050|nr:DUF6638 family protein [Aliiroseovarius crassostreae]UWQ02163.1 hypothetical protein K3X44_02090 [Aliiroseovarius crassostreae]
MKRLIKRGLMFGNLIRVDSPALIARYNRALLKLTGKITDLTEFHIDISGFSPEIGEEFQDDAYLNPGGCNRQFIILTVDQKKAPLLNASFSTSRGILKQFMAENEAKLFALTAHDAVAGELDNSVYTVGDMRDLLAIRKISINADTTQSHVANARKLAEKIDHFQTVEGAWYDDQLIDEMIELARETGDVTRVPLDLGAPTYEQGNFWTSHFGGVYVFRDTQTPAIITAGDRAALKGAMIDRVYDLTDVNGIASFLKHNDLVEPVVKARGVDGARILHQKMQFMLVDAATNVGMDLGDMSERALRRVATRLGDRLPEAFRGLAAMVRWAEAGGKWPRIDSRHPSYFYTLRARPDHPDRDLINQLLSELAPLDVRQLFICHKQAFYDAYATWPDEKREFVAEFLHRDYMANKAGARERLFGGEDRMVEEHPTPWGPAQNPWSRAKAGGAEKPASVDRRIDRVGPWGSIGKGGRR